MQAPSLTLGIEEEYQIIDPRTRELRSYITEILKGDHIILEEIKPELHQSMVEIGSKVCRTPSDVRNELVRLRGGVMDLAAKNGLAIVAAGTHPFSSWITQEITPLERYIGVKADLADLAQQLLIFGTHIHVGIEDKEFMIDAMNVSRVSAAARLALSRAHRSWMGRRTGSNHMKHHLQNFRAPASRRSCARTAIHNECSSRSCARTPSPTAPRSGWTVRPHHTYPTLEFRVCDVCTRVEEVSAARRSCRLSSPSSGSFAAKHEYALSVDADRGDKWRTVRMVSTGISSTRQ